MSTPRGKKTNSAARPASTFPAASSRHQPRAHTSGWTCLRVSAPAFFHIAAPLTRLLLRDHLFLRDPACYCETPPFIARPHMLLRDPTCYCETPPVIARPTCHHLPRFQRVTPNVAPVATLPASCCVAQYASFFQPMETQFYAPNVQFFDPLINLEGVDAYQNNVGMLAGKSHTSLTQVSHKSHTSLTHKSHTQVSHTSLTQVSHVLFSPFVTRRVSSPYTRHFGLSCDNSGKNPLGSALFSDCGLVMHVIESVSERTLRTRWTLQFRFKLLPWRPLAQFSGVSEYTLDEQARVLRQDDYWDSIDLKKGGGYERAGGTAGI